MTEIPTWLLWLIGAFIPVVTAVVGITTVTVNAKTSRREEAMRLLRWAGEQAVDPVGELANVMGLQALIALDKSGILKKDDKRLLWAVTQAVLAPSVAGYPDAVDVVDISVAGPEGGDDT